MEHEVFKPENKTRTNQQVRASVKRILEEEGGREKGILRTGSNRSKRARLFAIGFMFRDPDLSPRTGISHLMVGKKEMIFEISPGSKPPYFLKCRIIKGERISPEFLELAKKIFLEVKEDGIFEYCVISGVEEMVRRLVRGVSQC